MDDSEKISPALRARLQRLPPAQQIRVLVMLQTPESDSQRDAAGYADNVCSETVPVLASVDAALSRNIGQRLSPQANALGFITVTTNTAGLLALANLPHVTAIMEDQKIKGHH